MKRAKCTMGKVVAVLLVLILAFSGMATVVATQANLENVHEIDSITDNESRRNQEVLHPPNRTPDNNNQEYAVLQEPTHTVRMEASQNCELGMSVADGYAIITFDSFAPINATMPESITVRTPYYFNLTNAHMAYHSDFPFLGWMQDVIGEFFAPGQTALITGSGAVNLVAIWDFGGVTLSPTDPRISPPPPDIDSFYPTENNYTTQEVVQMPTHDILLAASSTCELGVLVANGYASVTFDSFAPIRVTLPENFTVSTPYYLKLTTALVPLNNDFPFLGWVHEGSGELVAPGHTVLITGSGVVELVALWDFGGVTLSPTDPRISPPPPHIDSLYPTTDYNTTQEVVQLPTHDILLAASSTCELGVLVATGYASVTFDSFAPIRVTLPENFTVSTPYYLKLTTALVPLNNDFPFLGWVHEGSGELVAPGHTVLITGSGVVELVALWDFGGVTLSPTDPRLSPPPPHSDTFYTIESYSLTQEHDARLNEPTHDIHIAASPFSELDMLATGFSHVTFNNTAPIYVILPEKRSISTPYFFVPKPPYSGFPFLGWVHEESGMFISPGQTVLITGSGTVNLIALWDFEGIILSFTDPRVVSPQSDSNALPSDEGHNAYIFPPPPYTEFGERVYFPPPAYGGGEQVYFPPPPYAEFGEQAYYPGLDRLADIDVTSSLMRITSVFISGTPRVGMTLTANFSLSGFLSNPVVTHQWQRWNGTQWLNIPGATGRTFVPPASDANGFIRVRVLGTGFNVAPGGFYSNWVQLAANLSTITSVPVSGTLRVGSTLTANPVYNPHITNPIVNFQWQRWTGTQWVNIVGATGRSFVPTAADAGGFIVVRVQGTGVNVTNAQQFSQTLQIAANLSTITSVSISGTPRVGNVLTANPVYNPHITNPIVNFQWQRHNSSTGQWLNIAGATGRTFVPTNTDAGGFVRVRVWGTGANVTTTPRYATHVQIAANPSSITNVTISGTLRVGSTLTANPVYSPAISNPTVNFQWQRWNSSTGQWLNIAGATGRTFVPTNTDAGGFVRVRVWGTGANVTTTPRYATHVQIAANPSTITNVTISGTLRVGSTLTANPVYNPAISNPAVNFQWQRWNSSTGQWLNIAGATGRTFVPTNTDAGGFVRVRVWGTGANVTTNPQYATHVQVAANLSTITSVSISGTPRVGSVLTANPVYNPAISNPAVNFQWQRWNGTQWVNIIGATGRNFTPVAAEANATIRVRVWGTGTNVTTAARYSNQVVVTGNLSTITNVTISGTPRVGNTLTANVTYNPAISNPAVNFQWQRWNGSTGQWVNIAGATGRTYVLAAADANGFVQVRVQGTGVNVSTTAQTSAWVQILPNVTNVTLTFNANGGTPATQQLTRQSGISIGTMPSNPTRTGHTFVGWFTTSATTGGTQVTSTTIVPTTNTTYWARWQLNISWVTFTDAESGMQFSVSNERVPQFGNHRNVYMGMASNFIAGYMDTSVSTDGTIWHVVERMYLFSDVPSPNSSQEVPFTGAIEINGIQVDFESFSILTNPFMNQRLGSFTWATFDRQINRWGASQTGNRLILDLLDRLIRLAEQVPAFAQSNLERALRALERILDSMAANAVTFGNGHFMRAMQMGHRIARGYVDWGGANNRFQQNNTRRSPGTPHNMTDVQFIMNRGFIYGQAHTPQSYLRIGFAGTGRSAGCGPFAIYNAVFYLNGRRAPLNPANIIHSLELMGGVNFGGKLGANPEAVLEFLRTRGAASIQYSPTNMDSQIRNAGASILLFHEPVGTFHYAMIRYDRNAPVGQRFVMYNSFSSDTSHRPEISIDTWANSGNITPLALITIPN